jgi:hypothetical protein
MPPPLEGTFNMSTYEDEQFRPNGERCTFTMEPIELPLHRDDTSDMDGFRKDSVESFANVIKFMGDRKKKFALSDRETIELAQNIVIKAIKRPKLRNELVCQLIKQTTNHPTP